MLFTYGFLAYVSSLCTRPPTVRHLILVWAMAASTYTAQVTDTISTSTDAARGIDPTTAKPSDRFLIGVLIALCVILGVCMVFLIKRVVTTTIRRLRRQRTAVNGIIQRKIRRRRPRLYDVRIDDARDLDNGERYDTLSMYNWENVQPLAMAVEYPVNQSNPDATSTVLTTDVQHTPVVVSSSCQSTSTSPNCKMEVDRGRIEEPLHSPDNLNRSYSSLDPIDATARICVLISLPSPSRSTRYRLPTPSHLNHPSELRTEGSYLVPPSSEVDTPPVQTLPSCLALGVAPSPLIVYQ